ncbi:MAG TPA: phosphoribosylglycinamide formyltransferase [Myxococcales bacterium]|nr:phosphoribosylglycinamide formyltransferase [Myxococcales bacterium]
MKLGVLASGRGSNLGAILTAARAGTIPEVALVLSNVPSSGALERARAAGVPSAALEPSGFPSRPAYEEALLARLRSAGVELVCLAGYMKILGRPVLDAYAGRVLNIHPSLLPAFPGLHAQRQAIAAGVRVSGCTVHFVDAGTDTGPIIGQVAVPVLPGDTEESLSARILEQEHRLYPEAIAWVAQGRVRCETSAGAQVARALWRDAPQAGGALPSPGL